MPVEPNTRPLPLKDRLSMRLGLVFLGTFLIAAVLLIAGTMFGAISDERQASSDPGGAAPVIVIDPKIRADLAKAISFDAIPPATEVKNPFLDRDGIGSNLTVAPATAVSQNARPGEAAATNTTTVAASGGGTGSSGASTPDATGYDPSALRARYDEWVFRQRRGEFVGSESETLAVEDLVPVGYASGGDRPDEVMLFSVSLCRTFSFPVGTRFFNGMLNSFDQREVLFLFQNGIRSKSYSSAGECQSGADSRAGSTSSGN